MTRASSPRIWRIDSEPCLFAGGVCGRNRQKTDSRTEPAAARRNWAEDASTRSLPIAIPITIHATVPNTRNRGNRRASVMFLSVMDVVRASVGKKQRQYANIRAYTAGKDVTRVTR